MISTLAAFLAENPALTALVGATLTGGVLFAIRAIPAQVANLVREAFSVTLTIDSDNEAYTHVSVWLARHKAARRARRLMLADAYNYERERWEQEVTLGGGWHLLFIGRAPLLIHRHIQDAEALAQALGQRRRERLTLITFGPAQGVIRSLIETAKTSYFGDGRIKVFFWCSGGYELADKRTKRDLSTVFLPATQKARLVGDLERFLASKARYAERGLPWRRGYLLEGPPGTGKTTLIHVLAGLIDRSIYVVNLNNLSDVELQRAVNLVGQDGVLVMEDIDGVKASHDRAAGTPANDPASPGLAVALAAESKGITLSGLLNAIDGVTARDGRILFMTSNHADRLDPALIRPGRVDVREVIDRLGPVETRAMIAAFRGGDDPALFTAIAADLPLAAAEIQGRLLAVENAVIQTGVSARSTIPVPRSPTPRAPATVSEDAA